MQQGTPALPQPPTMALAVPTTLGENIMLLQNWQMTNAASDQPMSMRSIM